MEDEGREEQEIAWFKMRKRHVALKVELGSKMVRLMENVEGAILKAQRE